MFKNDLIIALLAVVLFSCNSNPDSTKIDSRQYKVETVNRQRCSFDLPNNLYLGKIDSSFSEEGYFKIVSFKSGNIMQLFVFDSPIDPEEKFKSQEDALNSPEIFTAKTIENIPRFGNYEGKGVIMKGTYSGGVVTGSIKIFSFAEENKGFLVIRQMIHDDDTKDFDLVESTFHLK